MLRMQKSPKELEPQLSVQPSSPSEPERPPQPQPLFELTPPTQDPPETPVQTQIQYELQLSDTQHQNKPGWINSRRLLLFLGCTVCAALLGFHYYIHQYLNKADAEYPCLSPACQRVSVRLAGSADPFRRPCDYFLSTCGSDTLPSNSMGRPGDQSVPGPPQNPKEKVVCPEENAQSKERGDLRVGEEKVLDRKTLLLLHLMEILESKDRPGSTAVQKAKRFYRSCLDTKSIESAGAQPFLSLIQKLGGWAVSGPWYPTDFNSTLSLLMRDYATFPFFSLQLGRDPNEIPAGTTRRYIQIDQPDLLIPIKWNSKIQKSQAKTETLRPFLALCQRYLVLLGSPPSSSLSHAGMFISLSSELAVAAAPLHYRLSTGRLSQRMTIGELQSRAPAIDWLGCLQAAFHPLPLTEEDFVLLHNLAYIEQMSRVIGKWLSRHEFRIRGPLHTYMVFHLLHTLIPALDSRFSETAHRLSVALGNGEGVTPRWKHCVLQTERGFDSVLMELLGERMAHTEADEIIQNIFSSFKSKLQELKWSDQNSLRFVMNKVQSWSPRLLKAKPVSNATELDLLFSKVTVGTQSFFSNVLQLLSRNRDRRLRTEQRENAAVLSISSFLLGNELLLPLGMFVPPLFHPTYPRSVNYGVLGFLIAKDFLHLILPDIRSRSETVRSVGECVWTHYLTVTEKACGGGASSLSAAQQQETWVQYSALQITLQAYRRSLQTRPSDASISGLSLIRLLLTSFTQVNCASEPLRDVMPLEPSFLITVVCAEPDLCPTRLQCSNRTQQRSLQTC